MIVKYSQQIYSVRGLEYGSVENAWRNRDQWKRFSDKKQSTGKVFPMMITFFINVVFVLCNIIKESQNFIIKNVLKRTC